VAFDMDEVDQLRFDSLQKGFHTFGCDAASSSNRVEVYLDESLLQDLFTDIGDVIRIFLKSKGAVRAPTKHIIVIISDADGLCSGKRSEEVRVHDSSPVTLASYKFADRAPNSNS